MYGIGFNKMDTMQVARLIMQETGTYNQQYLRPYNTTMDARMLNEITDRALESGSSKFTANSFQGLAGNFIQQQANPEASINITNGWNERRIRFMLHLVCNYQTGGLINMYVLGYTDFMGISASHHIAPDMRFYVNTVMTTRTNTIRTPFGIQEMENVIDANHVLADMSWQDMRQPGTKRLIRPQDIYNTMELSHVPMDYNGYDQNGGTADMRTVLRSQAVMSQRGNNSPSVYAARVMDGFMSASKLSQFGQSDPEIYQEATKLVAEAPTQQNAFFAAVSAAAGGIPVGNSFTYRDLLGIDGNTDNQTKFNVLGPTEMATVHAAGQTSQWGGADQVTVAASTISQAVPALMMDLMLTRIAIKSTNHQLGGQMATTILDGQGFSKADLTPNFNIFMNRLHTEILANLTYNNQESYMLEMVADLLGESRIRLSMGNSPLIDFVTPSFCDALLVPVVTTDAGRLTSITNDFNVLVDNIRENSYQAGPRLGSGLV